MSGINAPRPSTAYLLEDDEKKVLMLEDTKVPNAATFTFNKEDHTLAGLLKSQLLLNPGVQFAGYKVPHPLEAKFVMSVQTDGKSTPWQAMNAACAEIISTLDDVRSKVSNEARNVRTLQEDTYGDE